MKLKITLICLFCLLCLLLTSYAKAWNWEFDPNKYSHSMTLTSVLKDADGVNIGSPDIELVAFKGSEVRAVCSSIWKNNKYVYYMMIYGNPGENETIVIKAYYKATGQPVKIGGKAIETPPAPLLVNESLGNVNKPSQIQEGVNIHLEGIDIDEKTQVYAVGTTARFVVKPIAFEQAGLTGFSVSYKQNNTTVANPTAVGSYDVVITRSGDATYQPYERTLKDALVIGKTAPTVTWPTGLMVQEEEALSTIVLPKPANGTFSWINSSFVCQGVGEYYQEMLFTPNSTNEYPVRNFVKVTINSIPRQNIVLTATAKQTVTYTAAKLAFAYTTNPVITTGFTVTYKLNNVAAEPINVGTYTVRIQRPKDGVYNALDTIFTGGLTIQQAEPTGITWPNNLEDAIAIKLSDIVLPTSTEGIFSWKNPNQQLVAGNQTPILIFTPTNKNYKPVEKAVTVKGLTRLSVDKTVQSFAYDGLKKAFTVKPIPAGVTGFTVSYSAGGKTIDPINAGTYNVKIVRQRVPADNYLALDTTLIGGLVITPSAYPADSIRQITWPDIAKVYVNQKLSEAKWTSIEPKGPGTFAWVNKDLLMSTAGSTTQKLRFTPANTNYTAVEQDVNIVVWTPVDIVINVAVQRKAFNDSVQAFIVMPTPNTLTGFKIAYAQKGDAVTGPKHVGVYDVTVTRPADADYKAFSKAIAGGLVITAVTYPDSLSRKLPWPDSVICNVGYPLSGITPGPVAEGKFAWAEPDMSFNTVGDYTAVLNFYPESKNFTFTSRTIKVKVKDRIEQSISLKKAWNWVSVNVKGVGDEPTNIEQFIANIGTKGQMLKSQKDSYLAYSNQAWDGPLDTIRPVQMYMLQVKDDHVLKFVGKPVNVSETPVTLNKGWSWVGYLPQFATTVTDALTGVTQVKVNDQIKGCDKFASYNGSEWIGSLEYMAPGEGYMYYSSNGTAHAFTYPSKPQSPGSFRSASNELFWKADAHQFESNMTVMATVKSSGEELTSGRYELGIFKGDECRGSICLKFNVKENRYLAYLTVHGTKDEKLEFRLYDHFTGKVLKKVESGAITYQDDDIVGSFKKPYSVSFSGTATDIEDIEDSYQVYPTRPTNRIYFSYPVEGVESLEVIHANGAIMLHTKVVANNSLDISNMAGGVYFLRIRYNGKMYQHTFIKQ